MADERVVATKLEQIEQFHGELQEKRDAIDRDTLHTDTTEQRAVERMFENAIQACGDLAKHIAANDFGFAGERSKEAVRILSDEDVIDQETADTLIAAIGFRNVLAHQYGTIDYDVVYEQLDTGLGVYNDFSTAVARWHRERTG